VLDWLAGLPPIAFVLVVAMGFCTLLAVLLLSELAAGARRDPYLPAAGRVVFDMRNESAQDYGDLIQLAAKLRGLLVRDPERQAVRDELLAKLTALTQAPYHFRGGYGSWPPAARPST
jgi:hypothetical protein